MGKIYVAATAAQKLEIRTLVFYITLRSLDFDYKRSKEQMDESIKILSEITGKYGLFLKLSDYSIHQKYSYRKEEKVFDGYQIVTSYSISIDMNKSEIIDELIESFGKILIDKEIETTFLNGYQSLLEDSLYLQAYNSCYQKGELLAKLAGKKIVSVESIEELSSPTPVYKRVNALSKGPDFSSADITVSKTLKICFEIA